MPVSAADGRAGYVQTGREAGREADTTVLGNEVAGAQGSAQHIGHKALHAACTKEAGVGHAWQDNSWLLPCCPFPVLCFSGPVAGRLCWPLSSLIES